jgi:hypothetical protein
MAREVVEINVQRPSIDFGKAQAFVSMIVSLDDLTNLSSQLISAWRGLPEFADKIMFFGKEGNELCTRMFGERIFAVICRARSRE